MSARLAAAADASLIASLWDAAVPAIVEFWPDPVIGGALLATTVGTSPSIEFYISGDNRAFFRVVIGPHLSDQTVPTEEMDIWVWPPKSNAAAIDAYCRELFRFWFDRAILRGRKPWGQLPPTAPSNSINWLNNNGLPARPSPDRTGWTVWEPDPGMVL